jgi:hypothetical protein
METLSRPHPEPGCIRLGWYLAAERPALPLVRGLWWACQDLNLGPHPYQQNAGEPLCGRPFSQVAPDRTGQSYVLSSRPVKCSPDALQASLKSIDYRRLLQRPYILHCHLTAQTHSSILVQHPTHTHPINWATAGRGPRAVLRRRVVTVACSSASACRLVGRIVRSACWARSGSAWQRSSAWLATPAWMAITAIAVAIVSCNSWASRSRFPLAGAAYSAASSQLCVICEVLIWSVDGSSHPHPIGCAGAGSYAAGHSPARKSSCSRCWCGPPPSWSLYSQTARRFGPA